MPSRPDLRRGRRRASKRLSKLLETKLEPKNSLSNNEFDGNSRGCNPMSSVTPLPSPEKPPSDPKSYRALELGNCARVILISEVPAGGRREQGPKINLPYISDSRNVYVGQSESERQREQHMVRDFCCNCGGGSDGTNFFNFENSFNDIENHMSLLPFTESPMAGIGNDDLADIVSCAVTVGSGFLDEPAKYGGLAHFCEHMVFLGSKAYPQEDEFMAVVREYGGQLNACTMPESTHYYYAIATRGQDDQILDRSLDLFSHFFTEPRFEIEAIKREINALDHEFRMKRPNDMVCRLEILKHTVGKGHPMRNFFWGDENTLGGDSSKAHYEDLRRHLMRFHNEHYVGPNITIALQGNLTLDELENKAVKFFSRLRGGKAPCKEVPSELQYPFDTPEFNRRYYVKPVGALDTLYLSWALPKSAWSDYETKPLAYLSSVISSDIRGGLADYLQREKLIVGLQCGLQIMSRTKYGVLFVIKMFPTDDGISNYDDIIDAVFAYLESIRSKGISPSSYKGMQDIRDANLSYYADYRPPLLNVKKLSYALHLYPPQHIINGDAKFYRFDRTTIDKVLDDLIPENMNSMLFSHGFGKQCFPHVESNTQCQFNFEDFGRADLRSWGVAASCAKFNVPTKPNPYMTRDFTKINYAGCMPKLMPLVNNERLRVTFIPIGINFPFGYFHTIIQSKPGRVTGNRKAMLHLLSSMLNYELREPMGLAGEAGIMSQIQPSPDGNLHILVYGYDKMSAKLLKDILGKISKTNFLNDKNFFELSKEYLLKVMHYLLLYPPSLALNLLHRAWKWGDQTMVETHSALVNIDLNQFREFVSDFMAQMKISLIALGNTHMEDVKDLADIVERMSYKALCNQASCCVEKGRPVAFPRIKLTWRVESFNRNGSTSTLINYHQFSYMTMETYALASVLIRMMAQPMFSDLRTHRALGYAVGSGLVAEGGILGAIFLIVSDAEKFDMGQLETEVEEFLMRFYEGRLKNMTQAEFREWAVRIPNCPMDLFTVENLKNFYVGHLLPGGQFCRKISIQVSGHDRSMKVGGGDQAMPSDEYRNKMKLQCYSPGGGEAQGTYFIQNIDVLHMFCPLYPAL